MAQQLYQRTLLDNGMQVITQYMPWAKTAALGLWVGVGARYETAQNNGLAHFLEHMAFKGTKRRSAFEIAHAIEAIGGSLDAYTAREQTAYYARVLPKDQEIVVDVIADIIQNSLFDPKEVTKEKGVILQEIRRTHDTPDDVIYDHFQDYAFKDQPIGRPILGRPEIVEALTADDLRAYVDQYYTGSNMVFAASGQVDHAQVVSWVQKHFTQIKKGQKNYALAPQYTGGFFDERRKDLEQAHYLLGFPSYGLNSSKHFQVSILAQILGGGMSSRLFQEIREKRGLVYSIYAFSWAYSDCGVFGIYAGTDQENFNEMKSLIDKELIKACDDLQEEELQRAKASLLMSMQASQESVKSRLETLAYQTLVFGAPLDPEETLAKVNAVQIDDLKILVREMIASVRTTAVIQPENEFS